MYNPKSLVVKDIVSNLDTSITKEEELDMLVAQLPDDKQKKLMKILWKYNNSKTTVDEIKTMMRLLFKYKDNINHITEVVELMSDDRGVMNIIDRFDMISLSNPGIAENQIVSNIEEMKNKVGGAIYTYNWINTIDKESSHIIRGLYRLFKEEVESQGSRILAEAKRVMKSGFIILEKKFYYNILDEIIYEIRNTLEINYSQQDWLTCLHDNINEEEYIKMKDLLICIYTGNFRLKYINEGTIDFSEISNKRYNRLHKLNVISYKKLCGRVYPIFTSYIIRNLSTFVEVICGLLDPHGWFRDYMVRDQYGALLYPMMRNSGHIVQNKYIADIMSPFCDAVGDQVSLLESADTIREIQFQLRNILSYGDIDRPLYNRILHMSDGILAYSVLAQSFEDVDLMRLAEWEIINSRCNGYHVYSVTNPLLYFRSMSMRKKSSKTIIEILTGTTDKTQYVVDKSILNSNVCNDFSLIYSNKCEMSENFNVRDRLVELSDGLLFKDITSDFLRKFNIYITGDIMAHLFVYESYEQFFLRDFSSTSYVNEYDIDLLCDPQTIKQALKELNFILHGRIIVYDITPNRYKIEVTVNSRVININMYAHDEIYNNIHRPHEHIIQSFGFACTRAWHDGVNFFCLPSYIISMVFRLNTDIRDVDKSKLIFEEVIKYSCKGFILASGGKLIEEIIDECVGLNELVDDNSGPDEYYLYGLE